MEKQAFSVRLAQLCLGLAYATIALVALLRLGRSIDVVFSLAAATGAFLTSRQVPDLYLPWREMWRVGTVGVILLAIGICAVVVGSEGGLGWAAVVLAYCAGNRFKASAYPDW